MQADSADASPGSLRAADASVWLFQFIKAMRDERGELIKNAHLLGFFRRICRWAAAYAAAAGSHAPCAALPPGSLSSSGAGSALAVLLGPAAGHYASPLNAQRPPVRRLLFHRIRPVFVFDGATPALKRRTTIARRRCVGCGGGAAWPAASIGVSARVSLCAHVLHPTAS